MLREGKVAYGDKTFTWVQTQKNGRYISPQLCHPSGSSIRFRSVAHLERHVTNMRGKALTNTHKPRRSAQKSRRNRGRK